MMNSISTLIEKYLKNQCSDEEIKELLSFFGKEEANEAELKELVFSKFSEAQENNELLEAIKNSEALKNSDRFIESSITKRHHIVKLGSLIRYAAAVVILLVTSFLAYNKYFTASPKQAQETIVSNTKPGTNKAILKLSTGESISLGGSLQSEELPKDISNPEDGLLVYDNNDASSKQSINELSTPVGGKYELVLSDGTRVILNSLSSLKYPQQFTGSKRVVELTGEAYFDVVKTTIAGKKVPFLVKTNKQIIEVLGTRFNISSYNDDVLQKTTLISGSVNILNPETGEKHATLAPGQQAVTNNNGVTSVTTTNTESAIAWVSGNFMFEDYYLQDILKQLARWYDVKVDYSNVPKTRFNILLSRNEDLKTILRSLEDAGKIKINLLNNIISISK